MLALCASAGNGYAAATQDDFYDPFEVNAPPPGTLDTGHEAQDPMEAYNRGMYFFNDKLYYFFLKPCARGYGAVVPHAARTSLKKFFHNLAFPVRFISCLAQGKIVGSGVELSRFVINTTAGIAGLFDPAKHYCRLSPYEEDMGQSFGVYGMDHGFYFIIPFLGLSSGRDAMGEIFNLALDPGTYLPGGTVFKSINNTSLKIGEYENLQQSAIDPYVAFREGYLQYRENLVKK